MTRARPFRLALLGLASLAQVTTLWTAARAEALCARRVDDSGSETVAFIGIALGRGAGDDPETLGPFSPQRFRVGQVVRGSLGVETGDVVEVDLAVNEQFENGLGIWVESSLGDAPLIGARYFVAAVPRTQSDGKVQYSASECAGSLDRLDDPEGARPVAQVLPVRNADPRPMAPLEGEEALPVAVIALAILAVCVVGVAVMPRLRRFRQG